MNFNNNTIAINISIDNILMYQQIISTEKWYTYPFNPVFLCY